MSDGRTPNPLVTVVVAVLNGEPFLARALRSILAQDYSPLEILVVDGRSTDRTEAIARSFPGVRFLVQPGTGIPDAYNHGWANAQGEFIAFLSCDDEWVPHKLSTQVAYLQGHPEVQVSMAHARYVLDPGCRVPPGFRTELLEGSHPGAMETLVARKDALGLVGSFDRSYRTAEDLDWVARARDAGVGLTRLSDALLIKHIHDSNLSLQWLENNRLILKLLRDSIARKQRADS